MHTDGKFSLPNLLRRLKFIDSDCINGGFAFIRSIESSLKKSQIGSGGDQRLINSDFIVVWAYLYMSPPYRGPKNPKQWSQVKIS